MAPHIKIVDSDTVGSRVLGHTEYGILLEDGNRRETLRKRFREFVALEASLQSVPGYTRSVPLPSKGLVGARHRLNLGDFNERRLQGLEAYLQDVVSQVDSLESVPVLASFLGNADECNGPADSEDVESGAFNTIDPASLFGLQPPVFMIPRVDVDVEAGNNGIVEVAFGESEEVDGVEVTVIFKDEDRPNAVEDRIYDTIRKPLFGRCEDVETFTFVRAPADSVWWFQQRGYASVLFKGTYAGEQDWSCAMPDHKSETLDFADFTLEGRRAVVWVNVWNHLFGPLNNNPDMEMVRVADYPCTHGTRKEIDSRYRGLITSVA